MFVHVFTFLFFLNCVLQYRVFGSVGNPKISILVLRACVPVVNKNGACIDEETVVYCFPAKVEWTFLCVDNGIFMIKMDKLDKFIRLGQAGEGTYGVVYKAKHKVTGKIVAIKKIKIEK